MSWVFLSVLVFAWGWPDVKVTLNGGSADRPNVLAGYTKFTLPVPGLHNRVYRMAPVAPLAAGADRAAEAEKAVMEIPWLATTGTGIFLAAILTALWLRIPAREFVAQFGRTVWEMRWALFTIASMLALAFTTKYGGSDATMGLNPMLIVASNSTGGVMGKMIDAQSIVVAAVATGQRGGEGKILRFVFLHSVVLGALVGALTMAQAYVLTWMIPN